MKKSQIYSLIILSISCFFFLLNSFVLKILNEYTIIGFMIIELGIVYFLLGFDSRKKRFEKDIILVLSISCILYYLLTYLSGIIFGFNYNIYSLKLFNIIKNIVPVIIIIIICEICRYHINSKIYDKKYLMALSFLLFFLIDTTLVISKLNYSNINNLIDNISLYIIPSIGKNILLTYLTTKVNYKAQIIYRFLMEIPIFFVPIVPNLGIYLQSVFEFSLPIVILFVINSFYNKLPINKEKIKSNNKNKKTLYIPLFIFLGIVISLTAGLFRHQALVIASGSMVPNLYRGDVVLVKKLNDSEKIKLDVGDILVFKRENKTIVHRIYKKLESGNEVFYETKGDNNENPDGYLIELNEVVGTTNIRIKYIGWPTILIYDLFNQ